MKIIVDDSLGFNSNPFPELIEFFYIKPVLSNTKRKEKLDLLYLHTDYFMDFPKIRNNKTIVYFYDPDYTCEKHLFRIRNILMPDNHLIPIKTNRNRAELLYMLYSINGWSGSKENKITYQSLVSYISFLESQITHWFIAPKVNIFTSTRALQKKYKPPIKHIYRKAQLINGKVKLIKAKDSFEEIWEDFVEKVSADHRIWVVRKGITAPVNMADMVYDLDEHSNPINIPFVQIALTPK